MALFCSRYLSSSPFALGLSTSEITKHAMTGYYGFQDYAAAFWWKHARLVIDKAAEIGKDLYHLTLQAVAEAMTEYGDCKDRLSPDRNRCLTDAVQAILMGSATDAREWESNFKIELRTREIRNGIETLLGERGSAETSDSVLMLYGAMRYKCPKPWCHAFSNGFESREDRHRHLLEHDRPFRCSVEGCYGNEIGFFSRADLDEHSERFHLNHSAVQFSSPRLFKPSSKAMLVAATKGDLAQLSACVSAGIPIDESRTGREGNNTLYLAVENGHIHACQYLLEQGANINSLVNDHGRTALHAAALEDNAELTHFLLSRPQIDSKLKDYDGYTAAGRAAQLHRNKSLYVFICRGLASRLGQGRSQNHTCLDIALEYGNLKGAELFSNASLDLNKESGLDFLLHRASRSGFAAGVKSILCSGRVDIDAVDGSGRQALHHACERGHNSVVELLLPHINDLGIEDESGRTAMQYAMEGGHAAVINNLLLRKHFGPHSPTKAVGTCLPWATFGMDSHLVRELFEKGVDPSSTDGHNKPLLMWAIETNQMKLVDILLDKGVHLNLDDYGPAVLWWATLNERLEVVKLLLEKGVDPNLRDHGNRPIFKWAIEGGRLKKVEF